MVFQIVDDIIDIFSDPADSGKTPGTDLREGVFTLPVLYALNEDSPAGRRLRTLLDAPVDTDERVTEALHLLTETQGRDRALADVHRWVTRANEHLSALPDTPAARALRELTDYTVRRVG